MSPYFDGAASLAIGTTLCVVALLLMHESKELLVGETASQEIIASIKALACDDAAIIGVRRVLTMVMGPSEVLLNLDAQLRATLSAAQVSAAHRG